MENPDSNLQVAISALIALIIPHFLMVNAAFSQFAGVKEAVAPINGLGLLMIFFFLPLLWWRHKAGYLGAMFLGIWGIVNSFIGVSEYLAGETIPEAILLLSGYLVISVVLIVSTATAWKKKK